MSLAVDKLQTGSRPLVMLAPLAGISDWPFRLLVSEMGADSTVTEMISAQGYLTAPKDARAYVYILQTDPGEAPVTAQVFGRDPRWIGQAVSRLTDTGLYAGIDINMGCPAPKVTSGGSGAALMKTPELAASLIRAARKGTCLPLSIKMRIGWDEHSINAVPFALMAQEEGVDSITVHGRTRAQQYAGKADWQTIAAVRQALHIPVIANGDVFTWQDARDILRVTGCAGMAIGRGALGMPWLFRQIRQFFEGQVPQAPTPQERLHTALRHARMMVAWKGEAHAIVEMRKYFAWYLKGLPGAAKVRSQLNTARMYQQVEHIFETFLLQLDSTIASVDTVDTSDQAGSQ
jgi:tRNA-dihydrouridine synthase B